MATNFLHAAGTNGFIVTPFQLFTSGDSGLSGLTNGSALTSAHGGAGTNGIFTQTDFVSAQRGLIWFNVVTTGWTPTVGGCIPGWWLHSDNATFESLVATPSATVPALPRPPDFIIPVYEGGNALAAGNFKFVIGVPELPWEKVKCVIQNMTGATFGAGAHLILCGPVADQY